MKVEDERHVRVQRPMVANTVWRNKPDKIVVSTREIMHLKATAYVSCFICMGLYNNFDEEMDVDIL